jgi:hypothetical protein
MRAEPLGALDCHSKVIRNPNAQGPFGNTLLHSAVVSGDAREVERLLAADEHVERLLDQALEATFPASDPIAVSPVSK